ncbi:SMODS domain-containing nucleotidyltransferase [Roseateles sp. P5_E1]
MSQQLPNRLLSLASLLEGTQSYQASQGLGLFSAAQAPEPPKWIHVTKRFSTFLGNLELTASQEVDGWTKIYGVVSCLNSAYYGSNSQTDHAFLIGSWAKGTQVRPPRDVDLYFLLPVDVYHRFEKYAAGVNKQSALLQEVKAKLLASYPTSNIKGDGPVVLAGFTSYSVEVVPAFLYSDEERSYYVCDTKNGGSYMKTMPLHEVDAITAADGRTAGNARRLIRMLKAWQAWCSVPIKSFYLELLAIEFLDQCEWRGKGYFYYDWISRDFFKWVITKANTHLWAPGTYQMLWLGEAWKSRAESAYARAAKACEFERSNDMANAGDEWQKIYGNDIPKWV